MAWHSLVTYGVMVLVWFLELWKVGNKYDMTVLFFYKNKFDFWSIKGQMRRMSGSIYRSIEIREREREKKK